jgi:cell division protein FtsL
MSMRAPSRATAAAAAPVRAPAPQPRSPQRDRQKPAEQPNRVLRVVRPNDLSPRARKRRARLAAAATCALVGLGLFATVVFHVVITQNQFRLDDLRDKATVEQTRYERLRLEVAHLESPDRVVATAQDRLGMVQPAKVSYLAPPATTAGTAGSSAPTAGSTNKGSWSAVKSQLASHP